MTGTVFYHRKHSVNICSINKIEKTQICENRKLSRTFQVPFQVIMEAFDRKDIHKEKLQLSSIGCLCHKKNESNLEAFKKIFQEKKNRKQVRYPFILTVLQSILFLCMFAKADTKKVNTFPVQSSPDIFPPMIWTLHKLLI